MADSQSSYPYLRRAELYLSNIPEWRGGGDEAQMLKIVGDGTTDNFRIRFEVQKDFITTAAPTYIYVYNLSSKLRQRLQVIDFNSDSQIELKIGWENFPMQSFFSGSLLAAFSERVEADIVTTIVSLSGYAGYTTSILSQTFAGGVPVSSIVRSIVNQIPGVTIDHIDISSTGKTGNQGYSMDPAIAKHHLDDLAKVYGFSWKIENNRFSACDDKKALPGGPLLISYKNGFLKRIEPILVTPFQYQPGVTIQSVIDPRVNVGSLVNVESQINPQLSKEYKVHTMQATGDTHGNEWDMRLESKVYSSEYESQMAAQQ